MRRIQVHKAHKITSFSWNQYIQEIDQFLQYGTKCFAKVSLTPIFTIQKNSLQPLGLLLNSYFI